MGLMLHVKTRQKAFIDRLASYGLCINYERTQEISNKLSAAVCAQFDQDGVVCPSQLRSGLFTVGALDNIDHNMTSRNAMDAFHGTAISLMQFPSSDKPGSIRNPLKIQLDGFVKDQLQLPLEYSEVPPVHALQSAYFAPKMTEGSLKADATLMEQSRSNQNEWLVKVAQTLENNIELVDREFISWAAYHASKESIKQRSPSLIALMPLFVEQAHTPAMIAHGMSVVRKAIQHLNPGQIPIVTMDQPLYSIAKQIQWSWPDEFGEKKFVVVLGALHIEMNLINLLGDLLDGSGWTRLISLAEVTTSGRADSVLKGSHVTRSRYVHQVTASTLYILQVGSFHYSIIG